MAGINGLLSLIRCSGTAQTTRLLSHTSIMASTGLIHTLYNPLLMRTADPTASTRAPPVHLRKVAGSAGAADLGAQAASQGRACVWKSAADGAEEECEGARAGPRVRRGAGRCVVVFLQKGEG